mgnify:CR=1 FL=1
MHALHARLPKNFVLEERLERYADAIELEPARLRGRWAEACWPGIGADGTAAPGPSRFREVRLDLGCGKGQFVVESARRNPDVLFVGMDAEPICVAYAAQRACESGLANVVIVPGNGMRVREFFSAGELGRIYLNFPTPFPKKKKAHLRLTYLDRLMGYRPLLERGAGIRLRTDSQPLRDFSLTQLDLAGYEITWRSDDVRVEFPDEPWSAYERKLTEQGACAFVERPAARPAEQQGFRPPQPQPAPEFRHTPRFQQPVQAPPAAPAAEEAEEDAAASGGEETPVIESKRKRNWSSIFQKTFDKINSSFTAAEDEEI